VTAPPEFAVNRSCRDSEIGGDGAATGTLIIRTTSTPNRDDRGGVTEHGGLGTID
jgi:hypothetical protein